MSTRHRGQLVSVVLSLASVSMTLAELRRARASADHAVGGFEVDELVGIAMSPGLDGARAFATNVASLSRELDQHGLLSCFYAAARAYGVKQAIDAFSDAFPQPWWREPWSGEHGTPRVCRNASSVRPLRA